MNIVGGPSEACFPKNVGLLFFNEAPHRFFPATQIDVVWFPLAAIEEALVNAIYHRSYEEREPVEVRITPQELTILSFPGADRSIRMEDLQTGRAISRRYRNRRVGEFLKELDLAEGRSTGIPKIRLDRLYGINMEAGMGDYELHGGNAPYSPAEYYQVRNGRIHNAFTVDYDYRTNIHHTLKKKPWSQVR